MTDIACRINCKCGGLVIRLDEDGIYYILTDQHTIIFRGICNECGRMVNVEKHILALYLNAPGINTIH